MGFMFDNMWTRFCSSQCHLCQFNAWRIRSGGQLLLYRRGTNQCDTLWDAQVSRLGHRHLEWMRQRLPATTNSRVPWWSRSNWRNALPIGNETNCARTMLYIQMGLCLVTGKLRAVSLNYTHLMGPFIATSSAANQKCSSSCGFGTRKRQQVCKRLFPKSLQNPYPRKKGQVVNRTMCAHIREPVYYPKIKKCKRQCTVAKWDISSWSKVKCDGPITNFGLALTASFVIGYVWIVFSRLWSRIFYSWSKMYTWPRHIEWQWLQYGTETD